MRAHHGLPERKQRPPSVSAFGVLSGKRVSSVLFCFVPKKPENEWQKVEYILELSEWLYYEQFPMEDVTFHLKWAVDVLMLISPAGDAPEGAGAGAVCSARGRPGVDVTSRPPLQPAAGAGTLGYYPRGQPGP